MTKLFLAAGVAALAIAAPVAADPGGKGGGKGQAAKVERGGGKGAAAKAERRGGGQRLALQDRGKGREVKAERRQQRAVIRDRDDRRTAKLDRKDRDVVRVRDFDDDGRFVSRFGPRGVARGLTGNCPPGLMDKGCVPPGLAQNALGRAVPLAFRDRLLPLGLRDVFRDDDDFVYRLGDGYVYRVDRDTNLIASILPLLGAGLMPGQMFPSTFGNAFMPTPFQAFYPDTRDDYYRFANGYVYEIDRDTGMIESIVPLMANGYGMGQMLPMSYSAYNVPFQYRSFYPDGGDHMYRYAPGAIYQVDPTTRLITAVASLLTGSGLSVGQPLPMGYSAYNVPLAYRDRYYDTPDAWYRYNNGHIYQVDPTTQLVTALIRSII